MTSRGLTLFDTPIGRCGIAWGGRGVIGLQLPEADDARALKRLERRFPNTAEATPPEEVQHAIESIVALLSGEQSDLSEIELDMTPVAPFEREVYRIARTIPPGETRTYGEVAERLGDKRLARDVGQAMARNPFPIVVPCHRVVAAGNRLGGFSAAGGVDTKLRMLAIEGAGRQIDLFATASL